MGIEKFLARNGGLRNREKKSPFLCQNAGTYWHVLEQGGRGKGKLMKMKKKEKTPDKEAFCERLIILQLEMKLKFPEKRVSSFFT